MLTVPVEEQKESYVVSGSILKSSLQGRPLSKICRVPDHFGTGSCRFARGTIGRPIIDDQNRLHVLQCLAGHLRDESPLGIGWNNRQNCVSTGIHRERTFGVPLSLSEVQLNFTGLGGLRLSSATRSPRRSVPW